MLPDAKIKIFLTASAEARADRRFKELQEKDIDNVLFEQKNRFDLSVVDKIAKMINEENFDVFHVHGARANFVAEFVMNKIKIPTVTTVHSDYLLDFDEPVKKLVFTNLNKRALKKIQYKIRKK